MVFDVLEDTDTANIVTTGNVDGGTVIELNSGLDLVGLKVELDGVVLLDVGVGETDGTAVVGHNVWDLVLAEDLLGNLKELELGLSGVNGVGDEATLGVVEHAEVLGGSGDGNNILETEGELVVSSDLAVNLDKTFLILADLEGLLTGKGVLQLLSEEDTNGDALTELVGAT